jgi:thiamine biosynthesis lipoprotein
MPLAHPANDLLHEFHAMGSPCRIRVAGAGLAPQRLAATRQALAAAEAEVRRIERAYSRYQPQSIVSRINAAAGNGQWQALDDETAGLLAFAAQLHRASGGLFDISSGVLRRVWDFAAARVPSPAELAPVLACVGWQQVELEGHRVRLLRAGMELDFGGFGKEYAADRAASVLQAAGLGHGYVNLGGDLRLLGPMADGSPWRLAWR